MLAPILNEPRRFYPRSILFENERGGRAGSEFPQSLTKRPRVPPHPTRRVVVEALGQTSTDSYTILTDQGRLHLQAEICFSSPLAPCSLLFFSWGHGRCAGVPAPILNEPRRFYPIFLRGSTSSDLATQARLPGNGGMSRTTAEGRSGRLKSRREGPSLMFEDDGTLSNQLLPPIADSTSQNTSNSSADAWLRERP